MGFNLRRIKDGEGDSGSLSQAIKWNEEGKFQEVISEYPTLGCSMLVGSMNARTYSNRDYWLTTEITEILKEIKNEDTLYVKFRTKNSVYEWWTGEYLKYKINEI